MTSQQNAEVGPFPASTALAPPAPAPAVRILFGLLKRLASGELDVIDHAGHAHRFVPRRSTGGRAEFTFRDWRPARAILTGGDIAFAEAWIDGGWNTPEPPALMTVLACNQPALERAFYGHAWQRALSRLRHWRNASSRRNAKRNVVAHYDLGNDFYRLWLDPTMTCSPALFSGEFSRCLASAQHAKFERVLAELALPPGAHILEIGCGRGGFAEVAAGAGYRVIGLSLSDAQTTFARERIARAGLAERVTRRLQDCGDTHETYDGVASIEMFEAVGETYWPQYLASIRRAVAPGGRACVQTITIADARFERYRAQSDFIQQYIFPGGMLASPSRFAAEAARGGFGVAARHAFGLDYAETLPRWLAAFDASLAQVRALGFDERFIRCWRYYLAYSIAGFLSGSTDVAQYTLVAR